MLKESSTTASITERKRSSPSGEGLRWVVLLVHEDDAAADADGTDQQEAAEGRSHQEHQQSDAVAAVGKALRGPQGGRDDSHPDEKEAHEEDCAMQNGVGPDSEDGRNDSTHAADDEHAGDNHHHRQPILVQRRGTHEPQ